MPNVLPLRIGPPPDPDTRDGVNVATQLRTTLSVFRYGRGDPTVRFTGNEFWRATLTPEGPATLHLWWSRDHLDAEAWGAGGDWMIARVAALTGLSDVGWMFDGSAHPTIRRAQRNHPVIRIGASFTLYHELLAAVLGQRVTGIEAVGQWRRLTLELGEPAPGPLADLRLPPEPHRLLGRPAWWFHPRGVEARRAEALRTVARHALRIAEWTELTPELAAFKLRLLPGIGAWTIGEALWRALGDPDAVPVGDYHVPNMVCWALAGEPRGTDSRMLELLEPYCGQRGRVIRLLGLDGHAAPKFGPRQRIQPMYRR